MVAAGGFGSAAVADQLGDLDGGAPVSMGAVKVTEGEPLSDEAARIQRKLATQVRAVRACACVLRGLGDRSVSVCCCLSWLLLLRLLQLLLLLLLTDCYCWGAYTTLSPPNPTLLDTCSISFLFSPIFRRKRIRILVFLTRQAKLNGKTSSGQMTYTVSERSFGLTEPPGNT